MDLVAISAVPVSASLSFLALICVVVAWGGETETMRESDMWSKAVVEQVSDR
jgi:hypothetical protein